MSKFLPENQQMQICLLKSGFESIEDALVLQVSIEYSRLDLIIYVRN